MNEVQRDSHPIPIVRAIISDAGGRVLLLRRASSTHENGGWCLPGGKVDYGQTIMDSLARELAEETSLELVVADFFYFQDSLPLFPGGMHCINFYFICQAKGELQLNDESSDHAWISRSDINNYNIVFRNDEAVHRFFTERG
jgi:8-oxo-dGTP diphosphatase